MQSKVWKNIGGIGQILHSALSTCTIYILAACSICNNMQAIIFYFRIGLKINYIVVRDYLHEMNGKKLSRAYRNHVVYVRSY